MKTPDEHFDALFVSYPALQPLREKIRQAFELLRQCAAANAAILVCGNGGSAADSEHIVGELMKGFYLKRPLPEEEKQKFSALPGGEDIAEKLQRGIRAISLVSQTGLISAFANDVDASLVFAQQVYAYAGAPQDVLIALSTSGNSQNVVNAAIAARAAGIRVISITGASGGSLAALSDAAICLPADSPAQVQELTLPVYHTLCAMLEATFFSE
ncbi:MAG: SIS domain-containing protein [Clostridia bacterium]|nr:SIS domain-containing protein [Clostridia bacterium]